MKLLKYIFLFIVLGGVLFFIQDITTPVCERARTYSIGELDARFKITKEELLVTVQKAENIWEIPTGFNLFEYDQEADFAINLIFDDRQEKTQQSQTIEKGLDVKENSLSTLGTEYKKASETYERARGAYTQRAEALETRLAQHNKQVEYWNKEGGAPETTYTQLQKESAAIDSLRLNLAEEHKNLEALRLSVNALADKNNTLASEYNDDVVTYNDIFETEQDFNQGNYNGKEINVYQFNEQSDLVLVLAHEFGHALNLDHVENSASIMYYLMDKQDVNNAKLSSQDIEALTVECYGGK